MWAQEELGPVEKHVASEALCSPVTYWVLDSLPAALVAIQFTKCASFYVCIQLWLATNHIKNAFLYEELKHPVSYECGGEVK